MDETAAGADAGAGIPGCPKEEAGTAHIESGGAAPSLDDGGKCPGNPGAELQASAATAEKAAAEETAGDTAAEAGGQQDTSDIQEYGLSLGVNVDCDQDLAWVVREAFNAPLPIAWSEFTDDEGRVYFFHAASSQSTWEHPMDAVYRELLGLVMQGRKEFPETPEEPRGGFIHNHLREVHQRALRGLEAWSGPYISQEGEYYYNDVLKASTWECPVNAWEQELIIRHNVLCRCLLPEDLIVAGDGSIAVRPGADQTTTGPDLLQALHLPLGLVRRDGPSGDAPDTPSTARSFHTARSMCSSRSQPQRTSARSPISEEPMENIPAASSQDESDEEPLSFTFGSSPDPAAAKKAQRSK